VGGQIVKATYKHTLEVLGVGGVSGMSKGLVELRETAVELCEEAGVVPGVWLPGGAGAFLCRDFCEQRVLIPRNSAGKYSP
jgi:hypothetical protein